MEFEMVPSDLNKAMNRRRVIRFILGAGAAVVAGGTMAKGASATSGSQWLLTTAALNLRAKASTSGKILLVIPANSIVKNTGQSSNGYTKVTYQGTTGWAYNQFLDEANGGSSDPDVEWVGNAETTSSVNFRYGPSTSDDVIKVLAAGTRVEYSDWVVGGYVYSRVNGTTGWIFANYLGPIEEEGPISFVTTTSVNLRENPSTSAKIIKVVPKGATVIDYDLVMSNGFRGVDYKGTVGWIYDSYLQEK